MVLYLSNGPRWCCVVLWGGGIPRQREERRRGFLVMLIVLVQQNKYCKTYHKIDKGNGAENKYDIATESHLHAWQPKLLQYKLQHNNAYKNLCLLFTTSTCHPEWKETELRNCITNLTHFLLQQQGARGNEKERSRCSTTKCY